MDLARYEPTYLAVVSYLPVPSLLNLFATCRRLAECQSDLEMWKVVLHRDFPWRSDDLITPNLYKGLTAQWTILRQPACNLCYRLSGDGITAEAVQLPRCEAWLQLPDGSLFLVVSSEARTSLVVTDPATWRQSELLRLPSKKLSPRLVFSLGKVFLIGGLPVSRDCDVVSLAGKSVRAMEALTVNCGEVFACVLPSGDIYVTSNGAAGRGVLRFEVIDPHTETYRKRFDVAGDSLMLGVVPGLGEELVLLSEGAVCTVSGEGEVGVVKKMREKARGFPLYLARKREVYILAGDEVFLYEKTEKSISKIRVFSTSAYVLSLAKETESVEEGELLLHGY